MSDFINYDLEMMRSAAHHGPDWFLQTFVRMANDSGTSVGVTLLVKGALVSGSIIGGAEYFETLGRQFGTAVGMTEEEGTKLWQPVVDQVYAKSELSEDADIDHQPEPSFIHLKSVRVLQGSALVPTDQAGVLWRGKLAEVDGFILGELGGPLS